MKRMFVANWKSNKTEQEARMWFEAISIHLPQVDFETRELLLCPSFTLLPFCSSYIKERSLPILLGAQNVSPYDPGAYTGEVNAQQIKEFCQYVIIGHSERRQNFSERDDMLSKKVVVSKKYGLSVIYCVQDEQTFIPENVDVVAYEPVFAIGTGNPDTPENVKRVLSEILAKSHKDKYLYGGSVTSSNVSSFLQVDLVGGLLVGSSSLNSESFFSLLLS